MTSIFFFPGQGSQSSGMGDDLFKLFPEITRQADSELGYSIQELCNGSTEKLAITSFTQVALYVVNSLYLFKALEDGLTPDYAAGHSVGEYNALLAAGAFDFLTGLKLVKKRGALMAQAISGGMAALMKCTPEEITAVLKTPGLEGLDIANYNGPSQTVISGKKEDILKAQEIFMKAGLRFYTVLQVGGAFHSRYMEPARQEFSQFISSLKFAQLQFPVISNLHAAPYNQESIAQTLSDQITHPVRWTESMNYLLKTPNPQFHELGPGQVLTNLVKRMQR